MSSIATNSLEQLARILSPESNASVLEKTSALQTFSATLNDNLTLTRSLEILNTVPLELFYLGFSVEDERLTTVLCEVINKILFPFSFEHVVSEENKVSHIRYLSLQQVSKCLVSDASVAMMVQSDLFPLTVATIAFQDTRTANKACELLFKMSSIPSGQEALFGATCVAMLKQLLQVNETIRFRIYDLLIKVASCSDSNFEQCESSGLLTVFVKELQSDDLLVKINAIELLNNIATTPAGLSFLEKANLLDTIVTVLDNTDDTDVVVQLIVTISAIGLLGSHSSGLKLVYHQSSLVQKLLEIYSRSVSQLKAVCLQSISKLLSVSGDDIEDLTLSIYQRMEGKSILIREAKQPEESLCIAAFAVMQAIASHIWGSQSWKYAIIQTMAAIPDASRIFGHYYPQIQVYVRQGAFYRVIEPAAAVENN
ncbi:proteasome non-ATPase 26S subunit-domain-containing protein [Gilbertella persicaria]|uniref:proteasome non-ATPase 26S subunit-domain-containing protein n=1 Tax=Gilbertella persicaria TaxID=101096 RepID=UPI00221F3E8A|nr:proteasome non-ATPase 26S subunit-domain-containing protein [Gilbertella persicaria]KAI8079124.1 proteasome non-ATPase 26S subunit-domain-containing protein [Gilbertella persicaria]